jgi:serine/threonine protein kinase
MSEKRYCIRCGLEFLSEDDTEFLCSDCRKSILRETDTWRETVKQTLPPQQISDWQPGEVLLDAFKIIGLVGESGISKVYRVEDLHSRKMLAMKCPSWRRDPAHSLEQARQEADMLFRLQGIPRVLQIEQAHLWQSASGGEAIPLIFTELAEAGDLNRAIHERRLYAGDKQAALTRVLDLAIQSAWGIHALHQKRILHGDIKPSNILLLTSGQIRIGGFGLPHILPAGQERVASQGFTPAFASPEQYRQDAISLKSDLWNWAVSVLEMFIGEVFWATGIFAQEVLENYLDEGVEDAALPVMPAMLAQLLRLCFQPDPADRPESMAWIARKLEWLYQHVTGSPYPAAGLEPCDFLDLNQLLYHGIWLFELEDYAGAAEKFAQAARCYPESGWARLNLGFAQLNLPHGKPRRAAESLLRMPWYSEERISIGSLARQWMQISGIYLDIQHKLVWVMGDTGKSMVGGPWLAPYSYQGNNLSPQQLSQFNGLGRWAGGDSLWVFEPSTAIDLGVRLVDDAASWHARDVLGWRCRKCKRSVSPWANRDGRSQELKDKVDYLCAACAEAQFLPDIAPIADYRPLKLISPSAYFTTYQAWHVPTRRVVTLQTFTQEQINRTRYLARNGWRGFPFDEIQHPNLVTPLGTGQEWELVYLVQELDPGIDLEKYLDRHGNHLSVEQAAEIILQVLQGLQYLHQRGMVHRNISSINIVVKGSDPQITARLTGFDLMLMAEPIDSPDDEAGDFSGTLLFMPPEQALNFRHVKPTGDIYAAGAVLYYLLTGCAPLPFPCRSELSKHMLQDPVKILLNENPIPIRQRAPDLPSAFAEVVDKAVRKAAGERFQTAQEFSDALEAALESIKVPDTISAGSMDTVSSDTVLNLHSVDSTAQLVCAFCGRDVSASANRDGRAAEWGNEVVYWCSKCAWRLYPLQGYPINQLGYVEFEHLDGRWGACALGVHQTTERVAIIRHVHGWRNGAKYIPLYLADLAKLAGIQHPNCTRLIETCSDASSVLVASAYVPGSNLSEIVATQGSISPLQAVVTILGLLDGLEQVHRLGLPYANLHPGNVLFHNQDLNSPKLCLADFNPDYLADTLDPEGDQPFEITFPMLFLAPDQLVGAVSQQTPACDLYSLGQVFYYLMTGETSIFSSEIDTLDRIRRFTMLVQSEPIPLVERAPHIHPGLAAVVDRAVRKRQADRFQSVEEFRSALQQARITARW